MSLNASRNQLVTLTRDLAARWQETRERWRDAKSREFEDRYLQGLWASVHAAFASVERLERIIAKVRSDCE